jgi:serine/threonine-protein kinase
VDRDGREEVIPAPPRPYYTPRLSPDGRRVVLYANDSERDQWVWDFARATLTRLSATPSQELNGVWTQDGRRVAYSSDIGGTRAIYWQAADGIGTAERLLETPESLWPTSITPDGKRLIYARGEYTAADLHVLTLDGERRSEPLIVTEFDENEAAISPDGRWLAYQSDASGQNEVYVQPFPTDGRRRWAISTAGGTEPLWSPDGQELFFRTSAGVMGVSVTTANGFAAGRPSLVVAGAYDYGRRSYDVSRDGKRFLMVKSAERVDSAGGPAGIEIVVVQHWFEDLRARVPVRDAR